MSRYCYNDYSATKISGSMVVLAHLRRRAVGEQCTSQTRIHNASAPMLAVGMHDQSAEETLPSIVSERRRAR